jgi:hypothetical protein
VSRTARAALYGSSMAVAVATLFGIYVFTTADVLAATLGLAGVVVFLTGGVILGVLLVRRSPEVARLPARTYLTALTLTLVLVSLYISLRYF